MHSRARVSRKVPAPVSRWANIAKLIARAKAFLVFTGALIEPLQCYPVKKGILFSFDHYTKCPSLSACKRSVIRSNDLNDSKW